LAIDILSDVLRAVRLRGAVFYDVSCYDEWAAGAAPSCEIARAVMPSAEHVAMFHMIVRGEGWAAVDGVPPVRVRAGDVVMFPRGDAHVMSSAPGLRPEPSSADWVFATSRDPKPIPVAYHRGVCTVNGGPDATRASALIICGFIGCDRTPYNPLLEALPRLLHIEADGVAGWVGAMLRQAVDESRERRAGSEAVLERLSEMVFVDAARRYLDRLPDDASGWLAGLRDRHVGRALARLHAEPARGWTLELLGREVALSRSALHERFSALVGLPPMQYLAQWRMQVASGLLRSGRAPVAAIALDVGYESEAAFSRAFKRVVGVPPAAWRRAHADAAAPT